MIIFYSKACEDCSGNHSLAKMRALCEKKQIKFENRRTVLWIRWKEEAETLSKTKNVRVPFFYSTEADIAVEGNTFTPTSELEKLIKLEKGE